MTLLDHYYSSARKVSNADDTLHDVANHVTVHRNFFSSFFPYTALFQPVSSHKRELDLGITNKHSLGGRL
jgi:hypothetical protein